MSAAMLRCSLHEQAHQMPRARTWIFLCNPDHIVLAERFLVDVAGFYQTVGEDQQLVTGAHLQITFFIEPLGELPQDRSRSMQLRGSPVRPDQQWRIAP